MTFRLSMLACVLALAGSADGAFAAKPSATNTYADVWITYAGQTFEFGGVQQTFTAGPDGGRLVFDLTVVGTPGYAALPDLDVSNLSATGNRWEVLSKVSNRSYSFIGTCAAQTFNTVDGNGDSVRELYLNCRDLQTGRN